MRVVLDTNVWLDLLVFDDPRSRWLLHRLTAGTWIALSDAACGDEWRRVLHYPALKLQHAAVESLRDRFDALTQAAGHGHAEASKPRLPRCRDRDDQKFLELAVAGGAALLLSRDDALLTLDRRTRAGFGFRIRTPEQASNDLRLERGPTDQQRDSSSA